MRCSYHSGGGPVPSSAEPSANIVPPAEGNASLFLLNFPMFVPSLSWQKYRFYIKFTPPRPKVRTVEQGELVDADIVLQAQDDLLRVYKKTHAHLFFECFP